MHFMKKLLILVTSITLLTVNACKKDNALPPIEPMDIAMPAIVFPLVNTPVQWSGMMQFKGIFFNLDSVIRAASNNKFTQQHVRVITVKSINLQLLGADAENNLGNYEKLDVYEIHGNVRKNMKAMDAKVDIVYHLE
jgi:hypothetical protein